MRNQKIITLSEEYLAKIASAVLLPLKNGDCVSCMFAAGGGKNTLIQYFLTNDNIIQKIFGDQYKKTLFVYVDPNEVLDISSQAYLSLILTNLIRRMNEEKIEVTQVENPLMTVKKNLENLIDLGWSVVFVLNDFEFTVSLPISIFTNMESILSVDKSRIVYLFLSSINLLNENVLHNFHSLKYAITRKVRYFSLFNREETDRLVDQTSKKIKLKVSDTLRYTLHELCGGHPRLLKYSLHLIQEEYKEDLKDDNKLRSFLYTHPQLKIVCGDIWNFLSEKERETLNSIATTGTTSQTQEEELSYLVNLGLVKENSKKKYKVFGTLFEELIKKKLPQHTLTYNAETKKLYYDRRSCEDKFTLQEFKLLVYFITHEDTLITRDQVAEAMWGKSYVDKYSDWSIDKTVSILRKKLDALGFPSEHLVTLKKRGFSFSNKL